MFIASTARSLILDVGVLNALLICCAVFVIIRYIHWRTKRQHMYKLAYNIPPAQATMVPILGHSLYFIGNTEKILQNVKQISSNSCSPCSVWLAHRLFFVLSTPENIEVALNSPKCLEKDDLYRFTEPMGGKGLLSLKVDTWKIHRKLIMPSFHQRILDQFVDVFVEESNNLVNILSKKVGKIFNIDEYIAPATLEMVTRTAMGVTMNNEVGNCKLIEQINRGLEIAFMRMFNIALQVDFVFNLTTLAREEQCIVKSFRNFINMVINDKRIANQRKKTEKLMDMVAEVNVTDVKERKVFLDQLMELSDNGLFTDQEVIDEVQTFMIAGSDTSGTVASFVLICLGMFPEYQRKVYEEIIEVVGSERDIEYTDIPKLKYLEMFIKETMRLFPVGPTIVRKVTEDLQLENYILPKDSGLVLCIYTIHRNDKYYPDHMKFDPERFSPQECAKRHPYAFLPFSGGPRNCIGMKFGYTLVKTLIATVTRKFFIESSFKSIEDIRVKQSVILKSSLGYPIKLSHRLTS